MRSLFLQEDVTGPVMASMLQPLSKPAQLYKLEPMKQVFDPCVQKALQFVNGQFIWFPLFRDNRQIVS